jgi:hypothetical protein
MYSIDTVPGFDLRITIQGTEPEIWRRLKLPETVTVPEFHRVVQAAFGWENRHLYGIRCTDLRGEGRVIVGPDEAAEDIGAEPASGVVLFELLDAQRTGPANFEYEYDFGDAWTHTVEVMGPAELPAGTLRGTDGANRGPVEDSGGPHGYRRVIEVLADPGAPGIQGHCRLVQVGHRRGPGDLHSYRVRRQCPQRPAGRARPAALAGAAHGRRDRRRRPSGPLVLSQVPADGLPLTQDGYLKPAFVKESL